jgi:hypothetical protein
MLVSAEKKFRYNEFVENYRSVFKEIGEGEYGYVSFVKDGYEYQTFKLSIFDPDVDTESNFLKVSSRDFKDNMVFYLNFIRYTLCGLIVTVHDKSKWVIEKDTDAEKYLLDRLKIKSHKELGDILLKGGLPELIGGKPKELNPKKKLLPTKKSLLTKCKLAEDKELAARLEINKLESEIRDREMKMVSLGGELRDLRNRYNNTCNPNPFPD